MCMRTFSGLSRSHTRIVTRAPSWAPRYRVPNRGPYRLSKTIVLAPPASTTRSAFGAWAESNTPGTLHPVAMRLLLLRGCFRTFLSGATLCASRTDNSVRRFPQPRPATVCSVRLGACYGPPCILRPGMAFRRSPSRWRVHIVALSPISPLSRRNAELLRQGPPRLTRARQTVARTSRVADTRQLRPAKKCCPIRSPAAQDHLSATTPQHVRGPLSPRNCGTHQLIITTMR